MRMTTKLMILIGFISLSGCDYFGSKTIYLSCKGETDTLQYNKDMKKSVDNSYRDELGVVITKRKITLSGEGSVTYPKEMKICTWNESITFSEDCGTKSEEKESNKTKTLYSEIINSGDYNQLLKKITLFHRLDSYTRRQVTDKPVMYARTQSISEFKCEEVKDIK